MHEGHRQRLMEKLGNGDTLYEYEVLEILLFNAYPRRDVNPIAHELLNRFAGIREVFNASVDELCTVEGVGRNVAIYLKCLGRCLEMCDGCDNFGTVKNTAEFVELVKRRFRSKSVEFLELYCLDKGGRVKRICSFTSGDTERVDVQPEDIIKLISVHRPYGIFVAHNHINCKSKPSIADDAFTSQVQIICNLNNVKFYDHCIYAGENDIYSYFLTDRLELIKRQYSLDNLLKNGKQI